MIRRSCDADGFNRAVKRKPAFKSLRESGSRPSYEWERSVRTKSIAFQVASLCPSLNMVEWQPAGYAKGHRSFRYVLPGSAEGK